MSGADAGFMAASAGEMLRYGAMMRRASRGASNGSATDVFYASRDADALYRRLWPRHFHYAASVSLRKTQSPTPRATCPSPIFLFSIAFDAMG